MHLVLNIPAPTPNPPLVTNCTYTQLLHFQFGWEIKKIQLMYVLSSTDDLAYYAALSVRGRVMHCSRCLSICPSACPVPAPNATMKNYRSSKLAWRWPMLLVTGWPVWNQNIAIALRRKPIKSSKDSNIMWSGVYQSWKKARFLGKVFFRFLRF